MKRERGESREGWEKKELGRVKSEKEVKVQVKQHREQTTGKNRKRKPVLQKQGRGQERGQ